jgi:hypothetical protein
MNSKNAGGVRPGEERMNTLSLCGARELYMGGGENPTMQRNSSRPDPFSANGWHRAAMPDLHIMKKSI